VQEEERVELEEGKLADKGTNFKAGRQHRNRGRYNEYWDVPYGF
jgi:hypothetical protein